MLRIMHKITGISLVFFLLNACSTMAPLSTPTQQSSAERQQSLNSLTHWHIKGKIGVQTSDDAGSATLDWQQNHQQFTLSLMGPLGTNAITLKGQRGQVILTTADGKQVRAQSAEALLQEQWGFQLPVSYILFWIRGLPAPGTHSAITLDDHQRLRSLTQQGWNVRFLSYTNAANRELPRQIAITSPRLKAKIIIYTWKID